MKLEMLMTCAFWIFMFYEFASGIGFNLHKRALISLLKMRTFFGNRKINSIWIIIMNWFLSFLFILMGYLKRIETFGVFCSFLVWVINGKEELEDGGRKFNGKTKRGSDWQIIWKLAKIKKIKAKFQNLKIPSEYFPTLDYYSFKKKTLLIFSQWSLLNLHFSLFHKK